MLKIKHNGDVRVVTKGSFEEYFEALGYEIVKDEQKEAVKDAKFEEPVKDVKEADEQEQVKNVKNK